jgi:hypothetical protein
MHSLGLYLSPQRYGLGDAFYSNDVCNHAVMPLVVFIFLSKCAGVPLSLHRISRMRSDHFESEGRYAAVIAEKVRNCQW